MKKLVLAALPKEGKMTRTTLSQNQLIPAVIYGKKTPASSVTVDFGSFNRVFKEGGHSHIIELSVNGKKQNVLVHEVQRHPVSGDVIHVDFFAVATGEKLVVEIPLKLVGNAPAAREGLLIEQQLDDVEVKCLPENLVDAFEVDVTGLAAAGDVIHVSDLKLGSKFEVITEGKQAVVSVVAPSNEEETSEAEAPAATETPAAE